MSRNLAGNCAAVTMSFSSDDREVSSPMKLVNNVLEIAVVRNLGVSWATSGISFATFLCEFWGAIFSTTRQNNWLLIAASVR